MLDNGTLDQLPGTTDLCKRQITNYVTQFFSAQQIRDVDNVYSLKETPMKTQQQMTMTALFNMWNRSSLILQTEDLGNRGISFLQKLIPELFGINEGKAPCHFEHANPSPDVNACGTTLATEPDAETRDIIMRHNKLDMLLFRSSQTMYDLQKQILLGEKTSSD